MEKMLKQFLREKRLQGCSKKTLQNYDDRIRPFCRFCKCTINNLTDDIIMDYFDSVLSRNVSKSTYATYMREVKVFLRYCADRFPVQYDWRALKVPKAYKKTVYMYNPEEIKTIFDTVKNSDPIMQIRNVAIISLMLDSGLRQSEVCGLLLKNIRIDERYIIVEGKGDKERYVPIGNYTVNAITEYLTIRPQSDLPQLFLSRRKGVLTPNAVKLMCSKVSKQLSFTLSSHRLRHNFATNYCVDSYEDNGNVDVFKLMHVMGHEELETTMMYLHLAYSLIAAKGGISHLDRLDTMNG